MEYATNNSSHLILLAIELILRIGTLHHLLVRLFQVLGEDDVSVVANRLQTGFLTNRRDIGTADLLRTIHKGLQIHLLAQVHLGGTRLEHESLLTSVGKRKLHLAIQTSRTHQRGVQHFRTIGRHDHLHVGRLVETIHLREELHQNSLDLTVAATRGVVTLQRNGIDLRHRRSMAILRR